MRISRAKKNQIIYLEGIGEAGQIALGDSCDIVRKGDNDGPVLTKLEVVCNDIVGVLLDLVLIVSVLDATEVPGDNIRPRTRHNSLLRFVHAGVETRRCEGDDLSHCSNVLRFEMQLDCLGLRKNKVNEKETCEYGDEYRELP